MKKSTQGKKGDNRPYIVMSKHCHLCHDQNIVNKQYGFDKDFIPLYIENKKDRVIIDQIQQHGIKIEGTPTFVCHDYTCSDAGARGPKLLMAFLQRAIKGYKYNPSQPGKKPFPLVPVLVFLVITVVGIAFLLEYLF